MSMPEDDAQLPLKKRARRRLVGAVALAVLAAVVLPMVMDQSPQSPVQDVQVRIPGQEPATPFNPRALTSRTAASAGDAEKAAAKPVEPAAEKPADRPVAKAAEKAPEKVPEKAPEKAPEKPADKPVEKTPEKTTVKAAEKSTEKATDRNGEESRRAAAILAGKSAGSDAKPAPAASGEFVILIGAFANPANVKQLQTKLGELGIKVYTEVLESPQGNKTRVRAGPFPTRDAADKALEKMKRIGVNGVVAAK